MTIANGRIISITQPSASYALVDLATVKDELSLSSVDTSNDVSLTRAIMSVSALIANYCNPPQAPFVVEARSDLFQFPRDVMAGIRSAGEDRVVLSRYPVLKIASVVQNLPDGTTQTLTAGTDYLPDMAKGLVMRLDAAGRLKRWESLPLTVSYLAGYGAIVSGEGHNIPAMSPYTVKATNASTFALDQGVAFANGTALANVSSNPAAGQYTIDAAGNYGFAVADAGKSIGLSYAFNQIPVDLVGHCLEMITARWKARGRDPALIQRETPGVGTERFWYGNAPGHIGPLPPRIQSALDNSYASPRIA